MMTQRSARASVALIEHQLHQINHLHLIWRLLVYSPVNKLVFVRKSSLKWLLFVGKYREVVPRYSWYCGTTAQHYYKYCCYCIAVLPSMRHISWAVLVMSLSYPLCTLCVLCALSNCLRLFAAIVHFHLPHPPSCISALNWIMYCVSQFHVQ